MRKTLIVILITLLFGTAAAQEASTLALGADESYRRGDYTAAIEGYENTLATGQGSATIFYNLGNAYYRDGQIGRAILNYERALRLKPGMGDARENLTLARSKTADRISELPQLFIVRWVNSLITRVTPATWRTLWLVLLALVGVAVVLLRLGRSVAVRKGGLIGGILAVVLLLLTTLLLVGSTRHFNAHDRAIVMDAAMTVKDSPEWPSADKMFLHEGTAVTITEELQGWYKIRIADGTTGWCESSSVERI